MGTERSQAHKKARGWWWKSPLIIIFLLAVTLVVLVANINSIALSQINSALETSFATGGHLDTFNLQILDGQLELSELTINPAEGFGSAAPISMGNITISVEVATLFDQPIIVNEITLDKLAITLVRDKQGELSVLHLLAKDSEKNNETPINKTNANEPLSIPEILVKNVRINNLTLQLIDQLVDEQWTASLAVDMAVENIQLNDLITRDIGIDSLNLAVNNLNIDQLPGFDDEKLLSLKQLSIKTEQLNAAAEELRIDEITLDTLSSSIQTNAEGLSNIQALIGALTSQPELASAANTDSSTQRPPSKQQTSPVSAAQKPLPIIHIEQVLMNNSSLTYNDEAIAGELMSFPLHNIEFEARKLRLFDTNPEAPPASLSLELELEQPESLPTAFIGAIAVMGPVNTGIPAINSQVRIGGFKLDTIDPLIPPSSRTALGANGFDAAIAVALNHQTINLNASVLSDQNIAYNAIAISGPIASPTIEMGAILAGVYSRFSDGLLNLGKGGINASLDIASSGIDIAEAVGSGTLNISKNLGKGLFETGTGLVTLDQQQLSEGLISSSKGTFDIGFDSVTESSTAATGGIRGSYHNLDGSNSLKAWNEAIKPRYEHSLQKAEASLLQMEYPPSTTSTQ